MKIFELVPIYEMTMFGGQSLTDDQLQQTFAYMEQHGAHVGDQDLHPMVKVMYGDGFVAYGIKENDRVVSVVNFKTINNMLELQAAHTLTPQRGQNHLKRILWFVKDQEGKTIIDSGVHTDDGIRATKSLANSGRFNMVWYNSETKEKVKYNPNTDHRDNTPFRAIDKKTPWRIMIEHATTPSLDRYYHQHPIIHGNTWIIFERKTNET